MYGAIQKPDIDSSLSLNSILSLRYKRTRETNGPRMFHFALPGENDFYLTGVFTLRLSISIGLSRGGTYAPSVLYEMGLK